MVTQLHTLKWLSLSLALALLAGRPSACSRARAAPEGGGGGPGSRQEELEEYLTSEGAGSSRQALGTSREVEGSHGVPGRRQAPALRVASARQVPGYQLPGQQVPSLQAARRPGGRHRVANPVPGHQASSHQVSSHQTSSHQVSQYEVTSRQVPSHQGSSLQGPKHQRATRQIPSHQVQGRRQVYPPATPPLPHRRTRRGNHLQFYGLEVPVYKFRGEDAQLKCKYDRRSDPLYSVKWYKDDHEFFSFMAKRNPPKKTFPRAGVDVDIYRSNSHLVLLRNLTFDSSGVYKCEVSADSPLFHTYYNESLMVVVELPDDDPKISGGQTHYAQGETARFNCTSSRSKPAAELTWYINEEPAKLSYLVPYYPYEHSDGLISRRLGLSFTVEKAHFDEGEMSLKCEAVVAAVYDPVGQDEAKVMERNPVVLDRGEAAIVVLSGASAVLPTYATVLVLVVLTGEQAVT